MDSKPDSPGAMASETDTRVIRCVPRPGLMSSMRVSRGAEVAVPVQQYIHAP